MAITLTPVALQRVQRFVAETGALGLRFGVSRTGCSGWGHVADLARDQRAGDTVFEQQGVKIFVDADSLALVDGTDHTSATPWPAGPPSGSRATISPP